MISKDYLYTKIWERPSLETLPKGSLYLYAHDPEDRSKFCANELEPNNPNTSFVNVVIDNNDQMTIVNNGNKVSLSSPKAISGFLNSYNHTCVYIEVTGMNCRLAAPLLNCALSNKMKVKVVYSEPKQYLLPEFKKVGINEDLSEAYRGVNPLPGFVKVLPHRVDPLFVMLLGFEGGRFSYLISSQQPSFDRIRPVVGVPGYRIDYPFESYWGNRNALRNSRAWERVTFAEANSIVDCYMTLKKLSYDNRDPEMVIAPIGTKPHAIGAILYAIKHMDKVELLYDNPIRSVHRTEGIGRVIVCNVSKLIDEN